MKQERTDRKSQWIFLREDPLVYINCDNCATTIETINDYEDALALDVIKQNLPKICPKCKLEMINGTREDNHHDKKRKCK